MSDTIIRVENLSKKYTIGHQKQEGYATIRDLISDGTKSILKPSQHSKSKVSSPISEEFWALKDVSFEIKQGDRVGIIGRNGAGKSTLLKILSRIVEPTNGSIRIKGRIASLLEVGTGFHPELTGRENISLNGAILGMSKAEIARKFDEIVGFAEVEKFLDTPVKRYSSGMYVRLAFSVAAHLEPDILIVDEVLAVGDSRFQAKCLKKMENVSEEQGRTVIVVSHNMQAVISVCNTAISLNNGKVDSIGTCESVVNQYLSTVYSKNSLREWRDRNTAPGNEVVKLHLVQAINKSGKNVEDFKISEIIGIQMIYEVLEEGEVLWQGYSFYNSEGINLFDSHNIRSKWYREHHPKGKFSSTVWIPANFLSEGVILVNCAVFNHSKHKVYFNEREAIIINVVDTLEPNGARGDCVGKFSGLIRPILDWETNNL
jgi:lipopolysaccharide transport system ATP-binding protein